MNPPALSVAEAQARLLARFRRLDAEAVDLANALGRTLAADAVALGDLPSFTNSAMDGYAVRAGDTAGASDLAPVGLRVVGLHAAGDAPSLVIGAKEAAAITTGAPLPAGADAVVRIEETEGGVKAVTLRAPVPPGTNVRQRGETVRAGSTIIAAGTSLSPGDIALLAATGIAEPSVVRAPRVAILSTGNELVPSSRALRDGQIWDANEPMLAALVARYGGVAIPLGIARDTADDLRRAIRAARDVEMILTSGGVSVGAYDTVRDVIAADGPLDFHQVRMRPGRPVTFGRWGETPILALPGNPVAAFVTFHCFARPALARMLGQTPEIPPMVSARVRRAIANRGGHVSYLRAVCCRTERGWDAEVLDDQRVGSIPGLSNANALLVIPEEVHLVAEGAIVQIIPLD